MTKIEWVKNPDGLQGITLNPIKGMCPMDCKDAQGKSYCYARRMYKRFGWDPEPRFDASVFEELHKLKKPTGIFVCSTFEWLFYDDCSWAILQYIKKFPEHRFYLLTKRPEKLIHFSPYPDNCWVGVSATNYTMANQGRYHLGKIKAHIKFISFEPLLERIADRHDCPFVIMGSGISWVIVGAMTPYSKKTAPDIRWVKEIVDAADKARIPVFLKDNLLELVNYKSPETDFAFNLEGLYRQEMPK